MWHDFRPEVIEKELAAAQHYYGINTLRVYLHIFQSSIRTQRARRVRNEE